MREIPEKGDLCRCREGKLGCVTSVTLGTDGRPVCRGFHLSPSKFGQRWQSVDPEFVGLNLIKHYVPYW